MGCSSVSSPPDLVAQAEADLALGKYEQAMEAYRSHRDERLAATDRPEWENPHFYTLLMGDVELRRQQPEKALELYKQAERELVTPALVTDRYRAIGSWYIQDNQFEKAIEFLRAHRARDPLLFDAMLDKAAKALIALDVSKKSPAIRPQHQRR